MRLRISPLFWFLGLPFIFFLAFGNQFLYLSGAEFSDLTISHLPNALYLRRSLLEWGQIPLWGNGILSGYPFVANPLSGLFYPPGWLALLWPDAWMFNLLAALHLVWGGLGMTLLLKQQGLRDLSALFGGLAFAFMPKLLAHFAAGHITLLYAVSWTPWLLYFSPDTSSSYSFRSAISSSLTLALIFFADVRWAAFAGLLWTGWHFFSALVHRNPRFFPSFFFTLILSAALSAPLALPLLEYVGLSTRATLSAEDVLAFSLPPARLLGFLFPEMGGNPEWIVYPGMITVALAMFCLFWPPVRQKMRFWWGVWLISIFYSFGENIPGLHWLAEIPGISLLRVPPRAMFLSGMALATIAAGSLDHLLSGLRAEERQRGMRALVILFGVTVMMAIGVGLITGEVPINFGWGAGMVGLVLFGLGTQMGARRPAPIWVSYVLIGISLLDWGGVAIRSLNPYPASEIVTEQVDVAEYLAAQPGLFRVYSPSYSLPQHTAARYDLELADGVDPMQLQSYVTFMESATGVPQAVYSVTMPPFGGEIRTANSDYLPDMTKLAMLNVRYVVTEFDLHSEALTQVESFGETRVYENTLSRSRVWIQDGTLIPDGNITWTPNHIHLTATGPGLLILSELAYPGWRVDVDGQPAELLVVEDLLRGVNLPAGTHQIQFSFHPSRLYMGAGLFGIAISIIVFLYFTRASRAASI